MIQRKQTVFLLFAVILTMCALSLPMGYIQHATMKADDTMYNFFILENTPQSPQSSTFNFTVAPLCLILGLTIFVSVVAIFKFKRRLLQAKLCVLNIVLVVIWYIIFGVFVYIPGLVAQHFIPNIVSDGLPFLSMIFYILARKGILADERLVRSMNRIR